MATRPVDQVSQAALERARARIPSLAPDSVEVVELARGEAYVVVRLRPSGLVVLDRLGRIVRGRDRLATVARHLAAVRLVERAFEEAKLDQRLEHAERSAALLGQTRPGRHLEEPVGLLVAELTRLGQLLRQLTDDAGRRAERVPTQRTLRRTISLLNETAAVDRAVVRRTRGLAAALASAGTPRGRADAAQTLRRWVVGRLASTDLRFYVAELEEGGDEAAVRTFVEAART